MEDGNDTDVRPPTQLGDCQSTRGMDTGPGQSPALEKLHSTLHPANSCLSETTQSPAAMQQLATMLMTSRPAEVAPAGPVLQEWMATFAVAVQQARREGEQNPQARALLASLMSLASVESPALMHTQGGRALEGGGSGGHGTQANEELKPYLPSSGSGSMTDGGEGQRTRPDKRQQPLSGEDDRPRKLARTATLPCPTSLAGPISMEMGAAQGGRAVIGRPEQAPWRGRANLVQHNSTPEPRRMAMGGHSQASGGRGRPSTQQFRVYSNAFQEPLPMPRWAAAKAARNKPREEASGNLGVDANRRPQLIVTGSSRGRREGGSAAAATAAASEPGWKGPPPGSSWGEGWKTSPAAAQTDAPKAPAPAPERQVSVFQQDSAPPSVRPQGEAAAAPRQLPGLPAGRPAEDSGPAGFTGALPGTMPHQDPPRPPVNPMDTQLAGAWLNHRLNTLGQALIYSEQNINHLMNPDSEALYPVLQRLQAAQQLQGAAAAQGGLPAAAALHSLMQLQQLAQTIGSQTGVDPSQLQQQATAARSQPQPETTGRSSAFPFFEGGRQQLMQPPSLGGSMLDHGMQPWSDSQLGKALGGSRPPFGGSSLPNNPSPLQQPLAMRPAIDPRDGSVPAPSGFYASPQGNPFRATPAPLPARGSGIPLPYLPTEMSISTNSRSDSRAEMASIPSLDSSITGPTKVDTNNPFEVVREQQAHGSALGSFEAQREKLAHASLREDDRRHAGFPRASQEHPAHTEEDYRHAGFPKLSPQRPKAVRAEPRGMVGAGIGRPTAVNRQHRKQSGPASQPSRDRSPSPKVEASRRGRPQGDEELAAETLLNLFAPSRPIQDREEDSPGQLRRPIKKRFRSRG